MCSIDRYLALLFSSYDSILRESFSFVLTAKHSTIVFSLFRAWYQKEKSRGEKSIRGTNGGYLGEKSYFYQNLNAEVNVIRQSYSSWRHPTGTKIDVQMPNF